MKYLKLLFTFSFVFLLSAKFYAQVVPVSGTLIDDNGDAIPGVNIVIKGTSNGTITDLNGNYSIDAPIGSTLVFSFVGMNSREVYIDNSYINKGETTTENNTDIKKPKKKLPLKLNIKEIVKQGRGTLVEGEGRLNDSIHYKISNSFLRNINYYYYNLGFKNISYNEKTREYELVKRNEYYGLNISFQSGISIDIPNKLPELQNTYAQGRPNGGLLTHFGPESGETYSWGSKLRVLEFDGEAYPYDKNGHLVLKGTGNGNEAKAYNPYHFFLTGFNYTNNFNLNFNLNRITISAEYKNKQQKGIIPGSKYNSNAFLLRFKNRRSDYKHKFNFSLFYSNKHANLPEMGANYAKIFHGLMSSPPSFDNLNALSSKEALQAPDVYVLSNGSNRSYSPGNIENPYYYINRAIDNHSTDKYGSRFTLRPRMPWDLNLDIALAFEAVDNKKNFETQTEHYSNRKDLFQKTNALVSVNRRFDFNSYENSNLVSYNYDYTSWELERRNNIPYANTNTELEIENLERNRNSHQLLISHESMFDWYNQSNLSINLSAQVYNSSSLPANKKNYFLPKVTVGSLWELWDHFSIWANATYSEGIKEFAVRNNNLHFNSTTINAANFRNYTENNELDLANKLKPELLKHKELSAKLSYNNRLRFEINYTYYHLIQDDALFPKYSNDAFILSNLAKTERKGHELNISANQRYGSLIWHASLGFHKYTSEVKELYSNNEKEIMAGFSDVSMNLIKNEPVGVLMGSSFLRNENNKLIIGSSGYPLVDPEPGIIGNPNPDWIASLSGKFKLSGIELRFVLEYKNGGDVWNGTKNTLNYYGTSRRSQEERDVTQYIFDGVLADGSRNNILVNFANPTMEVEENRWVRYGYTGVAEEAIEDASWLRLSNIQLSYIIPKGISNSLKLQELKLSVWAKNLLMYTPYSGVDPETSMFGYGITQGLDYFNMPGLKHFGFTFSLKF